MAFGNVDEIFAESAALSSAMLDLRLSMMLEAPPGAPQMAVRLLREGRTAECAEAVGISCGFKLIIPQATDLDIRLLL
jgi:hypothetical protein